MRRISIGEVLKETREGSGLDLSDMQRITHIQVAYLHALETDQFEAIPDERYRREFLERYAQALELDAAVILEAYERNALIEYEVDGDDHDMQAARPMRTKGRQQKGFLSGYLPLIYLMLTSLSILLFVLFVVLTRLKTTSVVPESVASEPVQTSSSTEASSTSETTSSSSSVPQTTLTTTVSGNYMYVEVSNSGRPAELTFSVADGNTRTLSASNTELASGVVLSGETSETKASLQEGVLYTLVNADMTTGLELRINDQAVDLSPLVKDQAVIIEINQVS